MFDHQWSNTLKQCTKKSIIGIKRFCFFLVCFFVFVFFWKCCWSQKNGRLLRGFWNSGQHHPQKVFLLKTKNLSCCFTLLIVITEWKINSNFLNHLSHPITSPFFVLVKQTPLHVVAMMQKQVKLEADELVFGCWAFIKIEWKQLKIGKIGQTNFLGQIGQHLFLFRFCCWVRDPVLRSAELFWTKVGTPHQKNKHQKLKKKKQSGQGGPVVLSRRLCSLFCGDISAHTVNNVPFVKISSSHHGRHPIRPLSSAPSVSSH